MARKDYYKILEISKSASLDDIRKAYKSLAKKYHPDVNKEPGAEEKFKEIAEAYSVLSDPDKRRRYDLGDSNFDSYADDVNFDANAFYEQFGNVFRDFGWGGFGTSGKRKEKPKEKGKDLKIKVSLTLDEIYSGVHKKYKINKQTTCHRCHGSGSDNNETTECPYCHGTGFETNVKRTNFGIQQMMTPCSHCGGTGEIITNPCPNCNGTGLEETVQEIEFNVPPGMPNGSYFTIPGQGNDGPHRGVPGNLIIVVNELENLKDIHRDEENNLTHTEWLKPSDFIFGKEVDVPWIDGINKIKIDAGSKSGQVKVLKGKGMPNPVNPSDKADYIVVFDCKFPKLSDFTKEEKEKLKALKDTGLF